MAILDRVIKSTSNSYHYHNVNPYSLLFPFTNNPVKDRNYRERNVCGYRKRFYCDKPIRSVSEYDAFYPESFYEVWETLKKFDFRFDSCRVAFVDGVKKLGHIEATIKYSEDTSYYESNHYVRIPSHRPDRCKMGSVYRYTCHEFPKKSKEQIVEYYKNTKDNGLFDTVVAYSTSTDQFLLSLDLCKMGGSFVVRMDDMFSERAESLSCLVTDLFHFVEVHKPTCNHPLDKGVFIVCKDKIGERDDYVGGSVDMMEKVQNSYRKEAQNHVIQFMRSVGQEAKNKLSEQSSDNSLESPDKVEKALEWLQENSLDPRSIYLNKEVSLEPDHDYTKFCFSKNGAVDVSNVNKKDRFPFQVPALHELKRKLNCVKRTIDTREQFVHNEVDNDIINWNNLTDCIDVYRYMKKFLAWKFNAEMATNAWMKIHEIIKNEQIIETCKKEDGTFKTFHLCEAPGAFISSINHIMKTEYTDKVDWEWYAQSLNPKLDHNSSTKNQSVIKDDYGLIRSYPEKWLFGQDKSGDITRESVIKSYRKDERLQDTDFITGDGGLRVPSNMFNEQEAYLVQTNFGQVLAMLNVLAPGKTCLFKTFIPFAEPFTVSLLFLLTTLFRSIEVVKPLTSHPSSSEVYVLCKGYEGMVYGESFNKRLLWVLQGARTNEGIVPLDMIPESFIEELVECSNLFVNKQIKSIKRSHDMRSVYFGDYDLQEKMSEIRQERTQEWLSDMGIRRLDDDDKLF